MNKKKILVTGCGGDIGQSIGKILQGSGFFESVIGADISVEHAGIFIYDEVVLLPRCSDQNYEAELKDIIRKYRIDFLLPIAEPELRRLTDLGIDEEYLGIPLVCANLQSRKVGFDKLATVDFLKESGLPFPETSKISSVTDPKFPVIVKSRNGSGSKSIFVAEDMDDVNFYKQKHPDFIVQALLNTSQDEFTCGLFRDSRKEIRSIIYKRRLVDSYSGYGEVVSHSGIEELLVNIAEGLNLRGSINVQLKFDDSRPCVFEINPRFSSTVLFRDMMGFRDLIWSLEDFSVNAVSNYNSPVIGTKFYKGFYEYTC